MATTASPSFSLPTPTPSRRLNPRKPRRIPVMSSDSSGDPAAPRHNPFVDTRIHWSNPDEGWIGGKKSSQPKDNKDDDKAKKEPPLGERFADLINQSTATHYQLSFPAIPSHHPPPNINNMGLKTEPLIRFLGVTAEADVEEIKAAYRRLSKEYHPDTTSLPLKAASEKFMQLREAYNVLSSVERRRFYDWTLAQEAEAERMRMELEDPYEVELSRYESVPDTVDRLGGKNMKLSDQAMTALTIDIFIILFSICSIIVYVVFFSER